MLQQRLYDNNMHYDYQGVRLHEKLQKNREAYSSKKKLNSSKITGAGLKPRQNASFEEQALSKSPSSFLVPLVLCEHIVLYYKLLSSTKLLKPEKATSGFLR
jgi:hypothetical protein